MTKEGIAMASESDAGNSHEQEIKACRHAEKNDSDENNLERIWGDLVIGVRGSWEEVVKMYEQNPRVSKVKFDNIIGNTALHLAVLSGRSDIVEKLVAVINERSEDPADILSTPNAQGHSPLHLAAHMGNIEMSKCIIGGHKHLLGIRNSRDSVTPIHQAALSGNIEAFFWLCEMCDSTAQAQDYCRDMNGKTVLHSAIEFEHWDLAFQIIHRHESLMDSVDDCGYSPLHVLAKKPTAFRSGIYLSFLDNIIYHSIHVEELMPETCKVKTKLRNLCDPKKYYQTCNSFFQVLLKLIKFLVSSGKSRQKSTKQLDAENLEEGQGYHSSNEAKGHSRYLSFIKLIASKILLVIFSITLGPSKTRKLKGIKEKHIWSLQIMNKLVDHAKKQESAMNQTSSTRHSAYGYFRRGQAEATPILLAAKNGVLEMVKNILEAFPMTILDKDSNENCIALLAVKNQQFHVYEFLLGYDHIVERGLVFNVVDCKFNTALHLAAMQHEYESWLMPTSLLQLQWKVKWYEYVKNSMPRGLSHCTNDEGLCPDEIFTRTHENLLDKSKKWLKSTGDSCSFVAALVATVAFASSATVPGGVNQDSGLPLFQHHLAFRLFAISSLLSLCSSFTSLLIFFTLLTSKYQFKDFSRNLPLSLFLGLTSLFVSMVSMLVCFCSGHFLMLDHTLKYVAIPIYALTFFAVTYFSLQKVPSFFVLLKTVFNRVPGRIYPKDSF